MSLFLKQFNTHSEYDAYINGSGAILPNVSICTTEEHVHYKPLVCEETTTYELVGSPSYPSEIEGSSSSFVMSFNYKKIDVDRKCNETITEGSDTVTVEIGTNPSTASSRTVEGTYDYYGLEIEYSVIQTKFETKVTAKYNVTSTSSPTKLCGLNAVSQFSGIEIDGVAQPSVVSAYTFSTTGEHTVKYTLTRPTIIGYETFYQCSGLTSIDIPNSVTSIGDWAFYACYGLTSIDIPSGVTSIGSSAFTNCRSLTSIDIPDSVTSIGSNAFSNCSGLTSCTIGSSVTSIRTSAFYGCSGLISCTIGSGVTTIGERAFQGCRSLTSIDIPSGVTSIGEGAFYNCRSLTNMTVDSNNTVYDSRNNCNGIINTSTNTLIAGCKNTVIPNSVTSIGDGAFSSCSGLTSIDIPSGVTSIGSNAFAGCSGLTSIDIPSGVTSIGDWAFNYCSSLASIVSNAVTAPTISSDTFRSVKTRGTLTVPQGSSGYDVWMQNANYYLGYYGWTKVEQ